MVNMAGLVSVTQSKLRTLVNFAWFNTNFIFPSFRCCCVFSTVPGHCHFTGDQDKHTGVTKDQVNDNDIHEVSLILLPVSTFLSHQSEKYGNSSTAFSNLFMSFLFYP